MRRLLTNTIAATLCATLVACTGMTETSNAETADADLTKRLTKAPIEHAALLIRESQPPQYAVQITSALPNGCAAFERIDVALAERNFEVSVWNSLPADKRIACTMIYRSTVNTAELGSNLVSGEKYQVTINGETRIDFTAE